MIHVLHTKKHGIIGAIVGTIAFILLPQVIGFIWHTVSHILQFFSGII